ncbi:MAG TPA: diguanylate cyclase, partial [Chloroflexota bacterium]
LSTLAAVLSREGYDVCTAATADPALDLAAAKPFDVVITDLMLPGAQQGLDIVLALRESRPSTEVIVLTGNATMSSAIEALRQGAFHYLTKPCNLDELKLTVQRAIEKQRLLSLAQSVERSEMARAEAVRDRRRLSDLFEQAPALIALCRGPRHRLEFANRAFRDVLGVGESEGPRLPEVLGEEGILDLLNNVRRTGQPFTGREMALSLPRPEGRRETRYFNFCLQPAPNDKRGQPGILLHAVDVTELVLSRHRVSQLAGILTEQALHDSLTGLPNRRLLFDRFNQALKTAERNRQRLGLLFLDIDNFKLINDSLGHAAGDLVLQRLGETVSGCLRASDTVGRLGGDEFAVLLPGIDRAAGASAVARKLQARLRKPLLVEGRPVRVRLSMGIAVYPDHGRDVAALMRKADAGMYANKRAHAQAALGGRGA